MAYCIGLYKTKKVLSTEYKWKGADWTGKEFMHYPEFEISTVVKDLHTDAILITITNTNATGPSATLLYSAGPNLLNTNLNDLIKNQSIPLATIVSGTRDKKLEEFVKQINDYSYMPFCIIMQFYMNPNSILTASYYPYELKLMTGLTPAPKENQMGELMLIVYEEFIVGSNLNNFISFNEMTTTLMPKTPTPNSLISGTYDISSFLKVDLSEIKRLKNEIDNLKAELAAANLAATANPATSTASNLSTIALIMSEFKSTIALKMSEFKSKIALIMSEFKSTIASSFGSKSVSAPISQSALCEFVNKPVNKLSSSSSSDTLTGNPTSEYEQKISAMRDKFNNALQMQPQTNSFVKKIKNSDGVKLEYIVEEQLIDKLFKQTKISKGEVDADMVRLTEIVCDTNGLTRYAENLHLILTGKKPNYSKSRLCEYLKGDANHHDQLENMKLTMFILPDADITKDNYELIKEGDKLKGPASNETIYTIKERINNALLTDVKPNGSEVPVTLISPNLATNGPNIVSTKGFKFVSSGIVNNAIKDCIETYNCIVTKIADGIEREMEKAPGPKSEDVALQPFNDNYMTGGGLKHNFAVQTAIPRIYRQVLEVHKTAGSVGPYERRTDYYNYA